MRMNLKERIQKYFREKSPFRITTDLLFYLLILAVLMPFSRKPISTGLNRLIMHRPAILKESRQPVLREEDYNWMLMDLEGNPVRFSSFRDRVIFFNHWATWCPPCRAEMPDIERLYRDYGNRVAMVLASQEEKSQLIGYLEEHGYDLPVYRLIQNPPEKLRSSSLPTTYLITAEGRITVRKTGAANWDGKFFRAYLDGLLEDVKVRTPSGTSR